MSARVWLTLAAVLVAAALIYGVVTGVEPQPLEFLPGSVGR